MKIKYISASFLSLCLLGCSTTFKSVDNLATVAKAVPLAPYQSQLDIMYLLTGNWLKSLDNIGTNWRDNVQQWWGHGSTGPEGALSKRNGFALTALYNYLYYNVGLKDYGMLDLKQFAADLGLPTTRSKGGGNCTTPDGNVSICNTNPDPSVPGDTNYNPNWGDIKSTVPFVDLTGNSDFLAWAFDNPAHWDGIDMILGYAMAITTGVNWLPKQFQDAGLKPTLQPVFSQDIFKTDIYTHGIIYSIMASVFGCSFVGKANVNGYPFSNKSGLRAFWATFYSPLGGGSGGFGANGDAINDPSKNFLFDQTGGSSKNTYESYNDYGLLLIYYINSFAHAYNEGIQISSLDPTKNPNIYQYIEKCSYYGTDDFGTIGKTGSSGDGFAANPLNFWLLGWTFNNVRSADINNFRYYLYEVMGYGCYNTGNWQAPYTLNGVNNMWDISTGAIINFALASVWSTAEYTTMLGMNNFNHTNMTVEWPENHGTKAWNPYHQVSGSIDYMGPSGDNFNNISKAPLILTDYRDNPLNESNDRGPATPAESKAKQDRYIYGERFQWGLMSRVSWGWRHRIEDQRPWKNGLSLWNFYFNFSSDYPQGKVNSWANWFSLWNNANNEVFLAKVNAEIQTLNQQIKNDDLGFDTKVPFPTVKDAFKNARPNNLNKISEMVSADIATASQAQQTALKNRQQEIRTKYENGNLGFTAADGAKHFIDEKDIENLANKAECDAFDAKGANLDLFLNEQKALLGTAQSLLAQDFSNADLGYTGSQKKYTLAEIQAQTHNKTDILIFRNGKYDGYQQEQQNLHLHNYQYVQSLYAAYDKGYPSQYSLKELSFYKNKAQLDAAADPSQGKQLDQFRGDEIKLHKAYQKVLYDDVSANYLFYDENPSGTPMLTFKEINNLIMNATTKQELDEIKGNEFVTFTNDQVSAWHTDLDKLKQQFGSFNLGYGTPLPDFEKTFTNKYQIDAARSDGGALLTYKNKEIDLRNKDAKNLEQEYNSKNLFYSQFLNGNPTTPQPDWSKVMADSGGWTKNQIATNRANNLPKYEDDQNKAFSEDLAKLKQEYQGYNLGYGTAGLPDFNNMFNKHDIDTARSNIDTFKNNQINERNDDVDNLKTEFSNASRGYTKRLDGTGLHFQAPDFNKLKDNDPTVGAHKSDVDNYRDNVLPNYEKEQIEIRNSDAYNLKREYNQESNGYVKKPNGNNLDNPIPDFDWIMGTKGDFGGTKEQIDYWKNHLNAFHEEQQKIYSEDVAAKDPAIVRVDEVIAYLNNTILFPNDGYNSTVDSVSNIDSNLGMPSNIIAFLKQHYGYLHYLKQSGMKDDERYLLFAEYGIYFIADHNTKTDTWSYMFYNQVLGKTVTYKATSLNFSIVKDKDDPDSHSLQINGTFVNSLGQKHTLTLTFNYAKPMESGKYPTPIINNPYSVVDMKFTVGNSVDEFYASISKPFNSKRVIETSGTYSVDDPNSNNPANDAPTPKQLNYFWHVYITTSGEWLVAIDIQYSYLADSNDPSHATYAGGKINMLDYKQLANGEFNSVDAGDVVSQLPDQSKPQPPTNNTAPKWLAGTIVGTVVGVLFIPAIAFAILRIKRQKSYISQVKKIERDEILAKQQQKELRHQKTVTHDKFSSQELSKKFRRGIRDEDQHKKD